MRIIKTKTNNNKITSNKLGNFTMGREISLTVSAVQDNYHS
jgi:hypothetical protein